MYNTSQSQLTYRMKRACAGFIWHRKNYHAMERMPLALSHALSWTVIFRLVHISLAHAHKLVLTLFDFRLFCRCSCGRVIFFDISFARMAITKESSPAWKYILLCLREWKSWTKTRLIGAKWRKQKTKQMGKKKKTLNVLASSSTRQTELQTIRMISNEILTNFFFFGFQFSLCCLFASLHCSCVHLAQRLSSFTASFIFEFIRSISLSRSRLVLLYIR